MSEQTHVTTVNVTRWSRGNSTWFIECSCGWKWDTSVRGTRRREVEARARAHARETALDKLF